MKKPLVGLTVDSSTDTTYSDYPWYALRHHYCKSIEDAGGIPFLIPHNLNLIDDYIDLIDGLVITGGRFDHNPDLYGADEVHQKTLLNTERTAFEFKLLNKALEKDLPFLGICAGQQLLSIVNGGSLIQYIPEHFPEGLNHLQEECRHQPTHSIDIMPGTLLSLCNNGEKLAHVNTSHQQAVLASNPGNGLVINSVAPDGVVEGTEDPSRNFCLGVQWHPEFQLSDFDRKIHSLFIKACQGEKIER